MPSRAPCTKTSTRHAHATSQRTARWRSGAKSAAATQAVSSSDADVLRLAEEISREAGELIKRKLGADIVKTKANARDLLTEVDTEVQDLLETRVRERFPDHSFLGEESGISLDEALDHSPEWLWIVDPIDGTTNFVHGIPMCAVSVGVAHREELAVGVIHDPFRDELFSARRGHGCFRNGTAVHVGAEATPMEAVVCTGYAPIAEATEPFLRGIAALARLPVRTLRMLGSAAVMFAWVADGRITAYAEVDLNAWDIAAGALLIQEAGGKITDLDGTPYTLRTRAVLASNGATHDSLLTALQDAKVEGLESKK